jgi:site-specific DNA-methyltransferase (adenine-specific)
MFKNNTSILNTVLQGDCLTELDKIEDKSIQLICIDPPYNINKDAWDSQWGKVKKGFKPKEGAGTEQDYYDWLGNVFAKLSTKMKDNGSFIFFHNDFRAMAALDNQIKEKTDLEYKNFIVWNKMFEGSKTYGFMKGFCQVEGLNNFQKMAEYMLFYTRDNTWKLKAKRQELGVKAGTIADEILSKTGKVTGWYNNLETGKNYPTEKTIVPITKHLGLTIEDIVPKFRNQREYSSVWNFEIDGNKRGHLTPKPIPLLQNIINHCTDPGDVILDCFGGSGSTAVASILSDRKFILVEKEDKYIEIINTRIQEAQHQKMFSSTDNSKND